MELSIMGVAFTHARDCYCPRRTMPCYVVCDFDTPFLYEKDGMLIKGNQGDLLIMEPGQVVYHGPRKNAEKGFVNDWFHIKGADFGMLLDRFALPLNKAFSIGSNHFLRPYAERAYQELRGNEPGRQEILQCIITEMVIAMHRAYIQAGSAKAPYASVAAVREEMLRTPGYAWQLSEMARRSGYSVSRFSEIYAQQFGVSPMREVLCQRIELAKQLLASGQASVAYVAEASGFQTINYFSKYFRQVTGMTPSQYSQMVIAGYCEDNSTSKAANKRLSNSLHRQNE